MRCLNHYIASASTVNNEKTRNLFKVLGLVFRTVVQSKRSGDNFCDDEGHTTKFRSQLDSVLDSLVSLMARQGKEDGKGRTQLSNTCQQSWIQFVQVVLMSLQIFANFS
ncbi:hypothetical protein COOONC_17800 [Cooperia oncophora]